MALNSTQLSVDYDLVFPIPLVIQNHNTLSIDGTQRLRLYPSVPATVYTNRGTVELTGEFRQDTFANIGVNFSGSSSIRPPLPISTLIGVELIGQLTRLTPEGYAIANIAADDFYLSRTGELVAPFPIWGPVNLTFTSDYRIIEYRPLISRNINGKEIRFSSGTVYAFYQGQSAEFDVEISVGSSQDREILYKVYSDTVNNDIGEPWELPPNWPESGDYPQGVSIPSYISPSDYPRPGQASVFQRVHEVGWYTSFGAVRKDAEVVKPAIPYKDSELYHPKTYVEFAKKARPGLERAFTRAIRQKDEILERLADEYEVFLGERS